MKQTIAASRLPQSGTAAYRDGPPEIEFAGRRWLRGQAQPIARADFDALQARPDAGPFAFTFTGGADSAVNSHLSEE